MSRRRFSYIDVVRCPLSQVSSEILSPRQVLEEYGRLDWCDLCGRCGSLFKLVEASWEDPVDKPQIEFEGGNEGYVLMPREFMMDSCFVDAVKEVVETFSPDVDIGIAWISGVRHLISGRWRSVIVNELQRAGVESLIALDRYTIALRRYIDVEPLSKFIVGRLAKGDLYLANPDLEITLLSSTYGFYRLEERRYLMMLEKHLFGAVEPTRHRVGLALAPLNKDYSEYLCSYLDLRIPSKSALVATVDPLVYIALGGCGIKRFIRIYLPRFVAEWVEKI